MCDPRYWGQIAELKADRIAVTMVEGGRDGMIRFLGSKERLDTEDEGSAKVQAGNWLYRIYKKYIENEAHPSMRYRLKLAQERGQWKWWEYIEHAVVIRKWLWMKKGWNGLYSLDKNDKF